MPPSGVSKTFAFLPTKEQQGSLEYASYCEKVAQRLKVYGWKYDAAASDTTDYFVFLSYAIDNGETISGVIPIYGQTGGGTAFSSGTVRTNYGTSATYTGTTTAPATFGQTGAIPYNRKEYGRQLILSIIDRAKSVENEVIKVYEGRVASSGSSSEISEVLPIMIEALFKDFPGKSGKTESVVLPFKQ